MSTVNSRSDMNSAKLLRESFSLSAVFFRLEFDASDKIEPPDTGFRFCN